MASLFQMKEPRRKCPGSCHCPARGEAPMAVPHSLVSSVFAEPQGKHPQSANKGHHRTSSALWTDSVRWSGFVQPFCFPGRQVVSFQSSALQGLHCVLCAKPSGWVAIMAQWGVLSYGKIPKNRNRKSWLTTKLHLIPECSTTLLLNRNLNFVMWIWSHKRITRILEIDRYLDLVQILCFSWSLYKILLLNCDSDSQKCRVLDSGLRKVIKCNY